MEARRQFNAPPLGRPIGTTQSLAWLVRNEHLLSTEYGDFTDDFYRRVAWINRQDRYVRPRTAQDKYTAVRDAMREMRPIRYVLGGALEEYQELEREYDRLFPLVAFEFPNPEQQRAEDLGLEYV